MRAAVRYTLVALLLGASVLAVEDHRGLAAQSTGLVAAYGFEEGTGTTAGDLSGSGNGGTLSAGTSWTAAGKFGNALQFNGSTSGVTVSDAASLDLTTGMTLEAWVRPTVTLKNWRAVVGKDVDRYYLMANTNGNIPGIGGTWTSGNQNFRQGPALPVNTWTHLAATYDGTIVRLYRNGVQVTTGNVPGALTTSNAVLTIGYNFYGERFTGLLDEVRIYNRALSAAEIQTDMVTPLATGTPPSNTAPTITTISNQAVAEDTATGAIGFTVGDAESVASSLTLSGGTSNATLVPPSNIVFGGSGASRTVTVTPAANQAGTATITVTVSDGQATAAANFLLTVTAVNDAPTITELPNQTTSVGVPVGPLALTVADVETSAATLTLSGGTSNPTLVPVTNIVFGGSGANRTVTVTPAPGQTGTATVTLTVSDGQASTPTSFFLTVTAANTNPTITAIGDQTVVEDTATGAIGFTVGDAESAASSLTLTGATSNATLVPLSNIVFGGSGASRTVTVTPAANQAGTATITVTVNDGQASAAASFLLTVTAVNDAPTISGLPNQTTTVGVPVGPLALTVADVETSAATLTLSGGTSNPTLVPVTNVVFGGSGANRTVTVTPAAGQTGTATITLTVSDGQASTPTSFLLTVSAIPAGLVGAYSFNEGTGANVGDLSGSGNVGTVSGATWTTAGKYGNALSFNGTSARVTIADAASLDLTNGMTVEAWVQPAVTLTGWRSVVTKDVDRYYLMGSSDQQSRPVIGGTFGTTNQNVFAPAGLPANTWTHLAATYDRTTIRLYVNGVQVATGLQTAAVSTSTGVLTVGANFYGEYFNGLIDEVRVYNRALTATEIQADMVVPLGATGPDTTPPSAPTGLSANGSSSSLIQLSWSPSTDNVGVTLYGLERCQGSTCTDFSQFATVMAPATTLDDNGLLAGTSYRYRVRAFDAAQNPSPYSNVASVTTPAPDVEPPSATGTLTATTVSGTQIDLSWAAASDNIGVIGYRLERCEGVGCTVFSKFGTTIVGTSFSDANLNVSTSYSYIVRAEDAAGNLGPYSNVATATTLATNPSLVAAYSFDEGAGASVGDASGRGNSGSTANTTWASIGKYGKALSFNGASALVTVPDSPSLRLSNGMTLAAWVNPTSGNNGWRDVVYKGDDNYYLEASTSSGAPGIGIIAGGTRAETYGPASLPLNTWTFLAATYDGTTLRLYVNGTQVSSQRAGGSLLTSGNPLQIGGDSIYGQFFAGMIDEVRIYSTALSPAQIQADMLTPVGASPALNASPSTVSFGTQPVGVSSAPRIVTVTNTGSQPLSITSLSISGPEAGDFSQTNNCVGSFLPGSSCSISIVFGPTVGGPRNATISIVDNAPGSPHPVTLSGSGDGFYVSPRTSVVTLGQAQQFTASGPGSTGAIWSVDGVIGGAPAIGTVTASGLYTAPGSVGNHVVMVTTSDGSQSLTATVYVTGAGGVFTHRYDNARTGQYLTETVLTPANVNAATFGKLASYSIDGIAHASPLYVANVNVAGVGIRNVVYVATEHNGLYAFDANGLSASPLWYRSFINPGAGVTTVPDDDVGEFFDITPEIGITGTPVIDPASQTLYVVVKTKESGNYVQRLHAIDIATGAEKFGGPVVIQASVPGTGLGSVGGQLSFNALRENQRTALLLHNGVVYFGFGSHGDNQPYHGWLLGYNATTLQQVFVFNTTPDGEGGGIWQSGGGLAIDSAGNFFFATGDGTFSQNTGGIDYGNTFLKLSPAGTVLDYFTPRNQAFFDANNLDLDAGGMILLPDQPGTHPHMLVSAGKDGSVFVVDRDNMGQYQDPDRNVQTLTNIFPFGTPLPGNYSSPVYFNGTVYFGPVADVVQAFSLTNGLLSSSPTSTTLVSYPYPGGALSISANGTSNGILWTIRKNGPSIGTLQAYDATNLAVELYTSEQAAGSRDSLSDPAAKFSLPLVINGRVYVASEGKFTIYGLLP
jgi:hypothetical protein